MMQDHLYQKVVLVIKLQCTAKIYKNQVNERGSKSISNQRAHTSWLLLLISGTD